MKENVGKTDKMARVTLSIGLIIAIYYDIIPQAWQWVALGLSQILLLTSALSFSPLYAILGENTSKTRRVSG
jgi:hypothetical protein